MALIVSSTRMSNTSYHRFGKPSWWARIGSGTSSKFLPIGKVRGDEILRATVDVEVGQTVYIGVGPQGRYGVRETVRALQPRQKEAQ